MITSTALQPTRKANGLAFDDIVRKAGLGAMPADGRFCPDRYVGRISDLGDQKDWSLIASSCQERDPALPAILLVMESPHKDEFSKKLWYTPWPANGPTGRQIRRHAHLLVPSDWVRCAIKDQCTTGDYRRIRRWEHEARTLAFTTSAISLGRVMLSCCVVRMMGPVKTIGFNPIESLFVRRAFSNDRAALESCGFPEQALWKPA